MDGRVLIIPISCMCYQEKEFVHLFFRNLKKRAWKHIGTLEWKWKRNGAPVPSEMGQIFGTRRRGDPYHLDLVLISLFFTNTESSSSPTSIEQNVLNKRNLLYVKHARFRSGKSYGFDESICYVSNLQSILFPIGAVDNGIPFFHYGTIHNRAKRRPSSKLFRNSGLDWPFALGLMNSIS